MPRMRAILVLTVGLAGLVACERFPEVEAAEAQLTHGPAPVLLPTDDLIAQTTPLPAIDPTAAALSARAAALQARADTIRAGGV